MPTQEGGSAGSPQQGGGGTIIVDAGLDVPVEGPEDPCSDPDATNIYLVTSTMKMYSWHPQTLQLDYRGLLSCPADNANPFSMAVTRTGTAYVVYNNGSLWEVDVTDASCKATSYEPYQHGIEGFGMGFAVNDDGVTERLYIAGTQYSEPNRTLGWIDLDSFTLQLVDKLSGAPAYRTEITADQQQLYAFLVDQQGTGTLASLDKATAVLSEMTPIPFGASIGAFHFALWGGDFYFFTTASGLPTTSIHRYVPTTQKMCLS